ncbi:hypothetical protein [Pararhizobium sp. O133]|uniref:hypothetical protein n=1 Tax=Pararhizobium sp. O133 TaxID=3449278 RepID=UPI003F688298
MPENFTLGEFDSLLAILGAISAGVLSWYTWIRERPLEARITFMVDAHVIATNEQNHIIDCVLAFENKGNTRVKIRSLSLTVRGIADKPWQYWEGHGNRLKFADEIFKDENLIPDVWKYMFVDPGVVQQFRYTTLVPRSYQVVLIYGKFLHRNRDPHTAQKIFAPESPATTPLPSH